MFIMEYLVALYYWLAENWRVLLDSLKEDAEAVHQTVFGLETPTTTNMEVSVIIQLTNI
jgi:hypothetical protein